MNSLEIAIGYSFLLAGCGLFLILLLPCRGRDIVWLNVIFLPAYLLRIVLVIGNESFQWMEGKGADERSLDLFSLVHQSGWDSSAVWGNSFFIQTLINYPGFAIFGPDRLVILITNAFFGALIAPIAYAYLKRFFGERPAGWGAMVFMFYPAAVNFSICGLRDILIFFFISVFLFSAYGLILRRESTLNRIFDFVVFSTTAFFLYKLRPELAPIVGIYILMMVMVNFSRFAKRISNIDEKMFVVALILVIGVALLSVSGLQAYRISLQAVGVARAIDPGELMDTYTMNRFKRAAGKEGGESHISTIDEYQNMSLPKRFVLQTLGVLLVPWPSPINATVRVAAAFDSLLVLILLFTGLKTAVKGRFREQRILAKISTLTFVSGVLAMGLVVTNSGNAFRMRLALIPLLIIAAAISKCGMKESVKVYRKPEGVYPMIVENAKS